MDEMIAIRPSCQGRQEMAMIGLCQVSEVIMIVAVDNKSRFSSGTNAFFHGEAWS